MTEELLPDWETRDGGRREWEDGSRQEWEDRQTWPREWEDRETWPREEKTREHQHTTWEQWSLWDQFGSTGEIIKVKITLVNVIILERSFRFSPKEMMKYFAGLRGDNSSKTEKE